LDTEQIKALLDRYRRGECTVAESELIERWLSTIRNNPDAQLDDGFINNQLNLVKSRVDDVIGASPVIGRRWNYSRWAIAASLLILCASAAIWIARSRRSTAAVSENEASIAQYTRNGWVYVQTKKGVTDHIKLPDGSLVTLDASSMLRYPVKFVNHKRPVYLDEGEGLFEVAKDKTSPFTVYTPKFATTALGTAFNIRSYAREHKVSISLLHGKIKVEDLHPAHKTGNLRILLPHQQVVLDKQSGLMKSSDFADETPITSWKDGVLSFKDANADEVINSIENRYNVVITNKSRRTAWSYTGTFRDQSLEDVLRTLCLTEGISCTITNNKNVTLN
jgi:ferric-dicitrate binding protein FerR (iron transport regulator)